MFFVLSLKKIKQSHRSIPFFILGLFLIDRFLKIVAETGQWLRLDYFENIGVAFSLPVSLPVFVAVAGGLLIWFIYEYRHQHKKADFLFELGFYLVIGGLLSNMFDRLMRGFVIDYFTFGAGLIFNLADVMILVGAIIFGWKLYLYEKK